MSPYPRACILMKKTLAALPTLLAATIGYASAADEVRLRDTWNLADMYATQAAWNADVARIEKDLATFAKCKGKLATSAKKLRECLDLEYDILERSSKVNTYASESEAGDSANSTFQGMNQKSGVIGAKISEETAFVAPEIIAMGKAKVDGFFKQEPKLAVYRHIVDDTLRSAAHTLDAKGEKILGIFSLTQGDASNAYQIFVTSDMPWPAFQSGGKEEKLNQPVYEKEREAADRAERKKAFDTFFGTWKEFESTLGTLLYSNLKENLVIAKARNYPDSMTAALDANNLPRSVYDALIKSANANLPTLHRYFRLRGKMLGVTDLRYYDIYPPLVKSEKKFPLDEGIAMMLAAVKPLGDDYAAAMKKGVDSRWMDVYPRSHKQSGAHMAGSAYDTHPYVLQNYIGNYESVSGMTHEWGHAMHSYYSNKTQAFANSSYATFVAEIASTMDENLLLEYALKNAKDDDERLLYLGSALENLRGTFFRQAMFGEFEQKIHEIADRGDPLTGADFTRIYGEILRRYHGEAQGVMKIDDLYCVEWAYIPHFYYNFYVFQYATSISASALFADRVLKGEPGALEKYRRLIAAGASDYPYDLVKAAGIDMATSAPYDAVAARMNRIMDEMEAILARRAKG
ncbi:MAG: oligoendopeptidase F [Usitatibacter sp.]